MSDKIESMVTITGAEYEALRAEVERLRAAISWIEPTFVDDRTPEKELRQRISYCVADSRRAALIPGSGS